MAMTDQADPPPAPEPTGPFYSTWGPLDGPILRSDEPPTIGVVGEPGGAWSIGMAFPTGQIEHRRGPAVTFRLVVGDLEPEERWPCWGGDSLDWEERRRNSDQGREDPHS
jgi:hypothetical protein